MYGVVQILRDKQKQRLFAAVSVSSELSHPRPQNEFCEEKCKNYSYRVEYEIIPVHASVSGHCSLCHFNNSAENDWCHHSQQKYSYSAHRLVRPEILQPHDRAKACVHAEMCKLVDVGNVDAIILRGLEEREEQYGCHHQ